MTDAQDTQTPDARPIVYIRKVAVADLPAEVQMQARGLKSLYAIGGENGEPIALVKDRASGLCRGSPKRHAADERALIHLKD